MHFEQGNYYHIYTRTNNKEVLFKSEENFIYFLERYRHYLESYLATLAYCLMPTHIHLLVWVRARVAIGYLSAKGDPIVRLKVSDASRSSSSVLKSPNASACSSAATPKQSINAITATAVCSATGKSKTGE